MKAMDKKLALLISGFVLFFAFAFPAVSGLDRSQSTEIKSSHCQMACCEGEKVNHRNCCCSELPAPKGKSSPLGGGSINTDRFVDLLVLDTDSLSPVRALEARLDMVGYTAGLSRPAPPPVKLFILNEAYLS